MTLSDCYGRGSTFLHYSQFDLCQRTWKDAIMRGIRKRNFVAKICIEYVFSIYFAYSITTPYQRDDRDASFQKKCQHLSSPQLLELDRL